jgi:hypothetical protein
MSEWTRYTLALAANDEKLIKVSANRHVEDSPYEAPSLTADG